MDNSKLRTFKSSVEGYAGSTHHELANRLNRNPLPLAPEMLLADTPVPELELLQKLAQPARNVLSVDSQKCQEIPTPC
jgi:hypothetical protein